MCTHAHAWKRTPWRFVSTSFAETSVTFVSTLQMCVWSHQTGSTQQLRNLQGARGGHGFCNRVYIIYIIYIYVCEARWTQNGTNTNLQRMCRKAEYESISASYCEILPRPNRKTHERDHLPMKLWYRINKKPSCDVFPWSECSAPGLCWCFPSSNPSASQIHSNPSFLLGSPGRCWYYSGSLSDSTGGLWIR